MLTENPALFGILLSFIFKLHSYLIFFKNSPITIPRSGLPISWS